MGNYPSVLAYQMDEWMDAWASSKPTPRVSPRYGWVPDVPDRRDIIVSHYPTDSDDDQSIPTSTEFNNTVDILRVDLRKDMPAVYDDAGLGCSTVSALAALLEFHELRQRPDTHYIPSRLVWYYLARELRGTVPADAGVSFRDAFKALNDEGVCDEQEWPFVANLLTVAPSWSTYESTPRSRGVVYKRVPQTLEALKHCLANRRPVACGLSVYVSFERGLTRRTGQIALPACAADLVEVNPDGAKDESVAAVDDDIHMGGHALVLVGYDDTDQCFLVRNSWGTGWGANGYGHIPFSYVLNPMLARDFWVIDSDREPTARPAAAESTVNDKHTEVDADKTTMEDASGRECLQSAHDSKRAVSDDLPPLFRELLDRVRR